MIPSLSEATAWFFYYTNPCNLIPHVSVSIFISRSLRSLFVLHNYKKGVSYCHEIFQFHCPFLHFIFWLFLQFFNFLSPLIFLNYFFVLFYITVQSSTTIFHMKLNCSTSIFHLHFTFPHLLSYKANFKRPRVLLKFFSTIFSQLF